MVPPSHSASSLFLTPRMISRPTIGLSLRSSLHLSQTLSCLPASSTLSTRPLSTPPLSLMRTSDFSALVSSSIVFHTPTGVACARALPAASAQSAAASGIKRRFMRFFLQGRAGSEQHLFHFHQRLQAGTRGADQAGRLRQQLGEVEARGGELGLVER